MDSMTNLKGETGREGHPDAELRPVGRGDRGRIRGSGR